nr:hypothetical protein [Tanacetum cinerariifolium]
NFCTALRCLKFWAEAWRLFKCYGVSWWCELGSFSCSGMPAFS